MSSLCNESPKQEREDELSHEELDITVEESLEEEFIVIQSDDTEGGNVHNDAINNLKVNMETPDSKCDKDNIDFAPVSISPSSLKQSAVAQVVTSDNGSASDCTNNGSTSSIDEADNIENDSEGGNIHDEETVSNLKVNMETPDSKCDKDDIGSAPVSISPSSLQQSTVDQVVASDNVSTNDCTNNGSTSSIDEADNIENDFDHDFPRPSLLSTIRNISIELSDDEESDDDGDYDRKSKAHHVIDVNELSVLVEAGQQDIRTLEGKDVVLIIGKTGVGKSTFIQMLNGATMIRKDRIYCAIEDENYLPDFAIGYEEKAKTKLVRSYANSASGMVFCDLPGYKDTDSCHIDIATAVWISDIARVSKSLRMIILIHNSSLYDARGESFRDMICLLSKLMKNNPEKFNTSMMMCFTHVSDLFDVEREDSVLLPEISNQIKNIRKGSKDSNNLRAGDEYLMNLIRTCIKQTNGYVRILNPVKTDVNEIVKFLQTNVVPIESAELFVQCSLPREIELAVSFAIERLETTVKEALYSCDMEKQQTLPDLINLLSAFVSMLPAENLNDMLKSVMRNVGIEYSQCKEVVLKVVDSTTSSNSTLNAVATTVIDDRKVFVLGNEEVEGIIPSFNKLRILGRILNNFGGIDGVVIGPNDVANIQLEYHRKVLLFTIDALGMMESSLDYSSVFQQIENVKCLESLIDVMGKHDAAKMNMRQVAMLILVYCVYSHP